MELATPIRSNLSSNKVWRLIRTGHSDGITNMAIDRALFQSTGAPPTLRLYGWKPWTLSLGYFQKEEGFGFESLRAQGYQIVRRPTGGSAVFHAEELTYSLTLDEDNPWIPRRVPDSYCAIHEAIRLGLKKLGVETQCRANAPKSSDARGQGFCFYDPTASDLLANGKKIVGSAQRRSKGRILHHGSIVLKTNPITPEVGSVKASGGNFNYLEAEKAMAQAFAETFQVQLSESEPSFEELATAETLQTDKRAESLRCASPI